jgi:hypothetical protein
MLLGSSFGPYGLLGYIRVGKHIFYQPQREHSSGGGREERERDTTQADGTALPHSKTIALNTETV